MQESIIESKSFNFAVRIVKLYQYLCELYKHCFNMQPIGPNGCLLVCFHIIEITDTTFFQ